MPSIKIIKAKKILHNNGSIIVYENSSQFRFKMQRVFYVFADKNKLRGNHAHKKCIQLISCLNGAVEIRCEDLKGKKYNFILNAPNKFLIIPKMIWCSQKYLKNNSIVSVICSKKFNEEDYIRDYLSFKKFYKR